VEQEASSPWSIAPQEIVDAFQGKLRRVLSGYGKDCSFSRRETWMDIGSTGSFALKTEPFLTVPRSKP
jgi:hypothetical protein